jgi:hypothetical protein
VLPDDPRARQERLVRAIEEGRREGKESLVIKAAKTVKHREVSGIGVAAGLVEGTKLYLAVFDGG